ncbi:MAG TPA: DinB family protein [Longimicrobiales bacterium]|nr:DinB family protein [Longimicrobiales bacterium]
MNGSTMLPEFDQEMANTRKALERVPEGELTFRPHEKSWTIRELAGHVAQVPGWLTVTLQTSELDLSHPFPQPKLDTTADILAAFDAALADARAALASASHDDLMATWTMKMGNDVLFSMPRATVLRSFVMNHMIHHRGQLTVYLRLCGASVPALYGPSADEEN